MTTWLKLWIKFSQKLDKLDQIESRISNFETSIISVTAEFEVHGLKAKMAEIEKNVVITSENFDEREKNIKGTSCRNEEIKKEIKEQLTSITNILKTLKDQHLDL